MPEIKLSSRKEELYKKESEMIKFLRRNPVYAVELLYGIKLMDCQKYALQMAWNSTYVNLTCSRNWGKSMLASIIVMLRSHLYENHKSYIISNSGGQAMETFVKLEDLAKQRIGSMRTLTDVFYQEVVKTNNSDGFIHDKSGYRAELFNGSKIFTLNSIPDNIRGKRSNLNVWDEASFCTDEIIDVTEPFLTQDSDFSLGVEEDFDPNVIRQNIPNMRLFLSSAGDIDSKHAKKYWDFAKKMVAGDSRYFVMDVPCDLPLAPLCDGEKVKPLLTQSEIDDALRLNYEKAMREYYNKFQVDGGASQMIKWAQIRHNESYTLPTMSNNEKNKKFAVAFDPARQHDNSIVSVMEILYDDTIGYYGNIVNCTNLIDLASKKNIQMKTPDQMKFLKQTVLDYNGKAVDYNNIYSVLIDAGSGGAGITAYADYLLEDWVGSDGLKHKGFIDYGSEMYEHERANYPNAWRNLRLVSPQQYRTTMCEELEELMNGNFIKFPYEYNGNSVIYLEDGTKYTLSIEEQVSLMNIDALKTELTSIHKSYNVQTGKTTYDIPKDKARKLHDDRFYTLLLLGHQLYELRREDALSKNRKLTSTDPSQFIITSQSKSSSTNRFGNSFQGFRR